LYKAQDVILESIKLLSDSGLNCHMFFVGDGEYKEKLQQMAIDLGVDDKVSFLGKISDRDHIKQLFDEADIFVLPSRQEGLPRAMIEAMSRALPCIGTNVGGIEELIDNDFIINVNDPQALADKVMLLANSPELLTEQSAKNLATSKEYRGSVVQARREAFYRGIKELS
jgi:glycosyltransferase involved in cell wall biosynthesis